jgi:hypothetical protein
VCHSAVQRDVKKRKEEWKNTEKRRSEKKKGDKKNT